MAFLGTLYIMFAEQKPYLYVKYFRLEKETGFKSWLFSMAFFTPWRFIAWVFASIANDMIFGYHIFMFLR